MNLTGKMLIAMPGMGDVRFEHSVVYMCRHDDKGAMGLVVNKPTAGLTLGDLLKQLDLDVGNFSGDGPVLFGGPVEGSRGFILHSCDYKLNLKTLTIPDSLCMTATIDVLGDIALGRGPKSALLMLGYAGWGPGQLEQEITMNGWLTCEASEHLVFDCAHAEKWTKALQSLGVDPLTLSASAGHA
ncbi:MAG: YqgE/AlgH family protein [Rhodobacteraceae bacterium]|nr:YqgE/AlgH family protein [Paracoccaceae bacterium]